MNDVFIDDVMPHLPADLQSVVNATSEHKGFKKCRVLTTALAVINFAAQKYYNVDPVLFDPAPLSEFFVILQDRSGSKSSLWKDFLTPIEAQIKSDGIRYGALMEVYDWEKALYDKAMKKGDENAHIPNKPIKPPHYDPFVENPTLNGIIEHLKTTPVAGVFTQEGAMMLNGYDARGKGSAVSFTTGLAKLWSGEPLKKNTGLEIVRLFDRRCNMLLMVQKELAGELFSRSAKAQGLFSRFCVVDHADWIKPYEDEAAATRTVYQREIGKFHKTIQSILSKKVETQGIDNAELILEILRFSPEAEAHRKTYSDMTIEAWNNNVGAQETGNHIEMLGKLYEHACRLAGTIAVFNGHKLISVDDWTAGFMLAQYYQTNLKYLIEPLIGDEHITNTADRELRAWISKTKTQGDEFTIRELKQTGPSMLRKLTTTQLVEVAAELEQDGVISSKTGKRGGIILTVT